MSRSPFLGGLAAALLMFTPSITRLGILFSLPGCHAAQNNSPAVAVLKRTRQDFGIVSAGTTLQAEFPVKNAGGRRLIVREVATSCECVTGVRPTILVQSKETVDLIVTLDTSGAQGRLQIESHYTTNDSRLPTFTLTLLADVQPLQIKSGSKSRIGAERFARSPEPPRQ